MAEELIRGDLSHEKSRQYSVIVGGVQVYERRFFDPVAVFYGRGHSFHRVLAKDGCVYLMPAPGPILKDGVAVGYCEVSWDPYDPGKPCQW